MPRSRRPSRRSEKTVKSENEIIVNVGAHETRVALLERGRLAEMKIEREAEVLGNIYKGRVENVVPGLDASFIDVGLSRNVFLYVGDAIPENGKRRRLRGAELPKISEVLRKGQEITVQVTKSPIGKKGARATARISLPGRYLVLMINSGRKVGVSKKITDEAERDRLRKLGEKVRPEEFGIIIRTQAEGVDQKQLAEDVKYLARLWEQIERRSPRHHAPALLHEDLSLVYGVLRDVFDESTKAFIVDNKDVHQQVMSWLETAGPELRSRVQRYDQPEPIFEHYNIETELEGALRPRVWLPHGGWIQIDQSEALTTIDVNSGKFTRTGSLADTVLRTNLEAIEEISRQLRLRDIGGIIVIDFIDMESARHRQQLMDALRRVMKSDRMKTRIVHLTPLGLVEMTRKRTGDSLAERLEQACPCCGGRGRILSAETVAVRVAEELARRVRERPNTEAYLVTLHSSVLRLVVGDGGQGVEELEERLERSLLFRGDSQLHPEQYEVREGSLGELEKDAGAYKPADRVTVAPSDLLVETEQGRLAMVNGYLLEVQPGDPSPDKELRVEFTAAGRSFGVARRVTAKRSGSRRRGGRSRSRKSSGQRRSKATNGGGGSDGGE